MRVVKVDGAERAALRRGADSAAGHGVGIAGKGLAVGSERVGVAGEGRGDVDAGVEGVDGVVAGAGGIGAGAKEELQVLGWAIDIHIVHHGGGDLLLRIPAWQRARRRPGWQLRGWQRTSW